MLVDARNYKNDPAYCAYLVEKLAGRHPEAMGWLALRIGCDVQRLEAIKSMVVQASYLEQYAFESLLNGIQRFRRNYMGKRSTSPIWPDLITQTRIVFAGTLKNAIANRQSLVNKSLGYSALELRASLESKFQSGMSWEIYPQWEVDHIQPVCTFNLWEPDIDRSVHALDNLQPLWATENQSKGDRCVAKYEQFA